MSAKAKAKLPAIETDDQCRSTIDDIARIEVQLRAREAKRDAAIQVIRSEHDEQIEKDKTRLASLMKLAGTYSNSHRETLFGSKKSAASALAVFGFRAGNPTIKPLNKKWTVESILAECKKLGKFFRTVEELDKEAIHAAKLTDVELAEIGIRIDSGERFFVDSKSEEADRLNADPQEPATV